jgi:hypothetical protein
MPCSTPLSILRSPHRLGLLGSVVVSVILVLGPRSSRAATSSYAPPEEDAPPLDRIYYQDGVITEYCYNESYNLGTCLGRQRLELIDYSQEKLVRCIDCSGGTTTLGGHETCDDIKALNDVGGGGGGLLGGEKGDGATIDWDESFCESYDRCVAENCPDQCRWEQDSFLECLVVELDCDWRCMPGSTWSIGETGGVGGGGATMMESAAPVGADVSAFSTFGSRMAAGLLLAGALM